MEEISVADVWREKCHKMVKYMNSDKCTDQEAYHIYTGSVASVLHLCEIADNIIKQIIHHAPTKERAMEDLRKFFITNVIRQSIASFLFQQGTPALLKEIGDYSPEFYEIFISEDIESHNVSS